MLEKSFEVQTTDDVLFEEDETFLVKLSNPTDTQRLPAPGIAKGEASGTIVNDDLAPSALTISVDTNASDPGAPTDVAEGAGAATVRVTATITSATRFAEDKTVTVEVGKAGDSAAEGTDYANVETQSITIKAGASSGHKDFTLTPTQDTLHEGNETISLEGTLSDVTVTDAEITLTDDDAAPTALTLSVDTNAAGDGTPTTVAEGGGATTVRVTATLDGTSTFTEAKTVTVDVGKSADSAAKGTDYANVPVQEIEIAAGASSGYKDFTLTPTDDQLHEGSETISLEGSLTGLTVIPASITLTDDDGAPTALTLTVNADTGTNNVQGSLAEDGGVKTVRVKATLSGSSTFNEAMTVTVEVGKDSDSAAEGTDYANVGTQSITITAGASSGFKDFTLTPTNDSLQEGKRTITLEGTLNGLTVIPASITLTDDDSAPTTLTLTVDADTGTDGIQDSVAEEGGAKTVRVTATLSGSSTFNAAKTVMVEVGKASDSATEGADYANVGTQSITITAGASSGFKDFTLTPTQDTLVEGDELVSLEGTLSGVTVAPASITLTDDDSAPSVLVLSVDADTGTDGIQDSVAEEGGAKTVRVTATLSGASTFTEAKTVTVEVGKASDSATEGAGGDYAEVDNQTIAIPAGAASGTVEFTLVPTSDVLHEGEETISINGTLSGVEVTPASVEIIDDDVAPSGITLTANPDTVAEEEDTTVIEITIEVNGPTRFAETKTITVMVGDEGDSAVEGVDYTAVNDFTITIAPGAADATATFKLTPTKDVHDEPDETISVNGTSSNLSITGDTITIVSNNTLLAAWLGRFGRTVAEQVLEGIAGRMTAERWPGMRGTLAGQAFAFDAGRPEPRGTASRTPGALSGNRTVTLGLTDVNQGPVPAFGAAETFNDHLSGGTQAQSLSMTAREVLQNSSFMLTGVEDSSGGSLAFWARATKGNFDGNSAGGTLAGEISTGMFGADYARGRWLVGLAISQSSGKGSIAPSGGGEETVDDVARTGSSRIEASLTAAIPYAAFDMSERLKLWGAAGYGTGEVTLTTAPGDRYRTETRWTMAAAGIRSDLLSAPLEGSAPALALTLDALMARTSAEETSDLLGADSNVTRLRLGLEGIYRLALTGGSSLTPKLAIGVRRDGGDAETGFGVELGGGVAWTDPELGLSLDLSGRKLLAHENGDLKDRGFSVQVAFDPDPASRRGPSFSLRQELGGQAADGLDALFDPAPLEDRSGSEATSRWTMDAAYGFPAYAGQFTGSPHVGFGLADGERDYRVGWRLTPETSNAPDLSFSVEAGRRHGDSVAPEHTIGFGMTLRW